MVKVGQRENIIIGTINKAVDFLLIAKGKILIYEDLDFSPKETTVI